MGKQARLYMVRSTQGALYDVFFERGVAALAWPMLAEAASKGFGREELTDIYRSAVPDVKLRTAQSGAAQMWRFVHELAVIGLAELQAALCIVRNGTMKKCRWCGRLSGWAKYAVMI